jgi:probable HAF family extracellular repeat protein
MKSNSFARIKVIFVLFFLMSIFIDSASAINSASSYSITDLGVLNIAGDTGSEPHSINNAGAIVGISGPFLPGAVYPQPSFSNYHAFLWKPVSPNSAIGTMTDLGGLPGYLCGVSTRTDTYANSINNSNQIVGKSWTGPADCGKTLGTGNLHAAIYNSNGLVSDLGYQLDQDIVGIASLTNLLYSDAYGINDKGQMVGQYFGYGITGTVPTYYAWYFDTRYHDLGTLPNLPVCGAVAVTNNLEILGSCQDLGLSAVRTFVHQESTALFSTLAPTDDIGTLGGNNTFAGGINQNGVVVGESGLANGDFHAFFRDGVDLVDLGTLNPASHPWSSANAINASNDIVGTSGTGTTFHAVMWKHVQARQSTATNGKIFTGSIIDLNSLLDSSLGWELTAATGINDSGQIIGYGLINGVRHGFLLNPCGSAGGDTDGDGLCDDWERYGTNVTDSSGKVVGFLNLPAMGADPNHKDIFVQTDYMVGNDHTHQPNPSAFEQVIAAFAAAPVTNPDGTTGINIHIDCGPTCIMDPVNGVTWSGFSRANALPHADTLGGLDVNGNFDWTEFELIKSSNFPPERALAFHYTVFAHYLGVYNPDGTLKGSSGVSRGIPTSDFIVSLANFTHMIGTDKEKGATFMHELGHNLGLHHGGTDDFNFKPNYLSLMNYAFQMPLLIVNGENSLFDYSRFDLPDLDENNLIEYFGLNGGIDLAGYGTSYFCPGNYQDGPNSVLASALNANGAIDWNCNSATDSGYAANINGDQDGNGADIYTVLTSSNDWSHLIFNGGGIGSLGVTGLALPTTTLNLDELTPAMNARIPQQLDVAVTCPGITQLLPGSSMDITYTVMNRGLKADIYAFSSTNMGNWWNLSNLPASIALPPGGSTQIVIRVNVPGPITAGSIGRLIIKATSQNHPKINDSCSAIINVISGVGLISEPTVAGLTQSAATSVITGAGLTVGTVSTTSSPTIPTGQVISQSPLAGSAVATASSVNLVISTGPVPILLPNVVGMTLNDATAALTSDSFGVGQVTPQISTTIAPGKIISQNPPAGVLVQPGGNIFLVVSSGASVNVPDLGGMSQGTAISAISSAGLSLGTVSTTLSATITAGNIISQTPAPSTPVAIGTKINLVVSSGLLVSVPDLANLSETVTLTALSQIGLNLGNIAYQTSTSVAAGNVISQNPVAATLVSPASLVNVVVSSGPLPVNVPSVVGLTQANATLTLTGVGLTVGTVTLQISSSVANGNVISQNPLATSQVAPGAPINLLVSSGPSLIVIPNVVGLTQAAASSALTAAGLSPGTITHPASATTAVGNVVSQFPLSGSALPPKSGVNLAISSGPIASVPNVVGLEYSMAIANVVAAGMISGVPDETLLPSSTVPLNDIIAQGIAPGTSVPAGTKLSLTISTGPATVTVPDVVGLHELVAQSTLSAVQLIGHQKEVQYSLTVPEGFIISQDPIAGSTAASGEAIFLVISSGFPSTVPDLIGMNYLSTGFSNALANASLYYGRLLFESSTTVPAYGVISQSPAPGTLVAGNNPNIPNSNYSPNVNLTLSSGPPSYVTMPDVVALKEAAAITLLTTLLTESNTGKGPSFQLTLQFSMSVPEGMVISQTPAAGSPAELGSVIQLVISSLNPSSTISTVAGHFENPQILEELLDNLPATQASFPSVSGIAVAPDGSFYFSVRSGPYIRKVDTSGFTHRIAGALSHESQVGGRGDGGSATHGMFFAPEQLALAPDGSLYITDYNDCRLRKIDPAGIISTVAGRDDFVTNSGVTTFGKNAGIFAGTNGYNGDGGLAIQAFVCPGGVALAQDGSIYLSEYMNNRIRKIDPAGNITTFAGTGAPGTGQGFSPSFGGDGGAAANALLDWPRAMALGPDGSLFVAEAGNQRVRKINPAGIITTVAGNGQGGFFGDGGQATNAWLNLTSGDNGIVVDKDGTLYINDRGNNVIRRVGVDGIICTVAGSGTQGFGGDGGLPTQASLNGATQIALGPDGSLYFGEDYNKVIRKVSAPIRCPGTIVPTVPDVVGMTQSTANTSIAGAGLILGAITNQASTSVPAGDVIAQNPAGGTLVALNSAINVVLSSGPPYILVPNVVSMLERTGTTTVVKSGLSLGMVTVQSSATVAFGGIISQSPLAGTSVVRGSSVDFVVSSGSASLLLVPNVVGMMQSVATTSITGATLVLGTVTIQSSSTVAAGLVISQSPSSGTSVNSGTPVNMVISSGTQTGHHEKEECRKEDGRRWDNCNDHSKEKRHRDKEREEIFSNHSEKDDLNVNIDDK